MTTKQLGNVKLKKKLTLKFTSFPPKCCKCKLLGQTKNICLLLPNTKKKPFVIQVTS